MDERWASILSKHKDRVFPNRKSKRQRDDEDRDENNNEPRSKGRRRTRRNRRNRHAQNAHRNEQYDNRSNPKIISLKSDLEAKFISFLPAPVWPDGGILE